MKLDFQKFINDLNKNLAKFDTREIENIQQSVVAQEDIGNDPESAAISVISAVETALTASEVVTHEDISDEELDERVKIARKLVLKALDPVKALKSKPKKDLVEELQASFEDAEIKPINADLVPNFMDENKLIDSVIAMEDYSTVDVKKSIFYTVAFNAYPKMQDDVVELFFPVVNIDPDANQAFVDVDVVHYVKPIKRLPNGKPQSYKGEPYIKSLENLQQFLIDGNRLYPILRVDGEWKNTDVLLNVSGVVRQVEKIDGLKVDTAPIKTGVRVDILGISQDDLLIAKGLMDELDTLDPYLNVEALYFKLKGKDKDGNEVEEYFRKDIVGIPLAFTNTQTGSIYDMQLNEKRILKFEAPFITVEGKKTAIKALADLTDGYYIRYKTNIKGEANIDEVYVNVKEFEHEVLGIYDNEGNRLPDDDYSDALDVLRNAELVGYDLEAYGNNDTAKYEGKRLNMSKYVFVYNVPRRVKISEKTPPFQLGSIKHPKGLYGLVNYTQQVMTAHGFTTLFNFIKSLDHVDNDVTNFGVANFLVDKFKGEYELDVVKVVNSLKSSERETDIQAALQLYIKNKAWEMYTNSNYKFAFAEYYPGQKPTVIIGTSARIGQFLTSFEDDTFRYVVKTSNYKIMSDKIIMSFGIMDSTRNSAPNPLNFGVCFRKPDIVLNFQVNESKKKYDESVVILGFKHQPLLPIISVINVLRLEEALKAIPIYTQSV